MACFSHSSTNAEQLNGIKIEGKSARLPQADVATRWNSNFDSLARVYSTLQHHKAWHGKRISQIKQKRKRDAAKNPIDKGLETFIGDTLGVLIKPYELTAASEGNDVRLNAAVLRVALTFKSMNARTILVPSGADCERAANLDELIKFRAKPGNEKIKMIKLDGRYFEAVDKRRTLADDDDAHKDDSDLEVLQRATPPAPSGLRWGAGRRERADRGRRTSWAHHHAPCRPHRSSARQRTCAQAFLPPR